MAQLGIELADLLFLDYVRSYYVHFIICPGNYITTLLDLEIVLMLTGALRFFFICQRKCSFEQLVPGLIVKLVFMNERFEMGLFFKHFMVLF
jgi:hypothetical protein